MLTPEQKEMWRRLDSLTSGLADLLQWNAADGNGVTSEDADRASCYLAIVGEVRRADVYKRQLKRRAETRDMQRELRG